MNDDDRDTHPSIPPQGPPPMLTEDGFKRILREAVGDKLLQIHSGLGRLESAMGALERRVSVLEIQRGSGPMALAVAAVVISVLALLRK